MYQNITIFQFFHWYYSAEGNLWQHAAEQAPYIKSLGITDVWLPPAYKSALGLAEPGYAVYDLYDLGEFDQKGTVRTRYGTRDEYLKCIEAFREQHVGVIVDIVLNHRMGGDETEEVPVRAVNPQNRLEYGEETTIEAHTKFTFPGRQGKYSEFVWDWHCFTGVDSSDKIYLILNEHTNGEWEQVAEEEMGNYDFLMGADIDFRNEYVREELIRWGHWYLDLTKATGLRLDAVKHIAPYFYNEWIDAMRSHFQKELFCIGEYWKNDPVHLLKYIEATEGRVQLFDVPLHFNFHQASVSEAYDMRQILDNTLLSHRPELAITFVDNHDTQPLQSLQSPVDFWFKPHAYAIILLRQQGIPCVFYPMLFEAKYIDVKDGEEVYIELNKVASIEQMLLVRKELAYGEQRDYFDHPNTVGWTREGLDERPESGCAVLITNGTEGFKSMEMGKKHAGTTFVDVAGGRQEKVVIDENGFGEFLVYEKNISVWVREDALKFFSRS